MIFCLPFKSQGPSNFQLEKRSFSLDGTSTFFLISGVALVILASATFGTSPTGVMTYCVASAELAMGIAILCLTIITRYRKVPSQANSSSSLKETLESEISGDESQVKQEAEVSSSQEEEALFQSRSWSETVMQESEITQVKQEAEVSSSQEEEALFQSRSWSETMMQESETTQVKQEEGVSPSQEEEALFQAASISWSEAIAQESETTQVKQEEVQPRSPTFSEERELARPLSLADIGNLETYKKSLLVDEKMMYLKELSKNLKGYTQSKADSTCQIQRDLNNIIFCINGKRIFSEKEIPDRFQALRPILHQGAFADLWGLLRNYYSNKNLNIEITQGDENPKIEINYPPYVKQSICTYSKNFKIWHISTTGKDPELLGLIESTLYLIEKTMEEIATWKISLPNQKQDL